jgi:hypothetical protein
MKLSPRNRIELTALATEVRLVDRQLVDEAQEQRAALVPVLHGI